LDREFSFEDRITANEELRQLQIIIGLSEITGDVVALVQLRSCRFPDQAFVEGGEDSIRRLTVFLASSGQDPSILRRPILAKGVQRLTEDRLPIGLNDLQERTTIDPLEHAHKL